MIIKVDTERKIVVVDTQAIVKLSELIDELTVLGLNRYHIMSEEQYGQFYK